MVVEKGFKHTNFGEVPIEWEVRKLGKIAVIKDGTHQTPKYFESGIPFYSVENVTSNDFNNTKFISELEHNFLTRHFRIEKGDVLMTRIGSIGDCKYVDWNPNASFYVSLALLKFDNPHIAKYFYHFSQSNIFKKEIELNSLQHAVPKKINLGNISIVRILLPNTEIEQTAIANALSDMDALIAQTENLIAKKKAIKQGVMQELLKPKEGWVTKKLGEVCEIKKGQLITDSTRVNGDIPVIAGGKTPAYYHNKSNRSGKTITISGSGASAGYVSFHDYPIFASDCSTISNSSKYNVEFIFYWLQLNQSLIFSLQTGGAQPHIHPSDLNPLDISLPIIEDQDQIAIIFRDLQSDINILETKLNKLKHQKQGMMQALLTGKIRLI